MKEEKVSGVCLEDRVGQLAAEDPVVDDFERVLVAAHVVAKLLLHALALQHRRRRTELAVRVQHHQVWRAWLSRGIGREEARRSRTVDVDEEGALGLLGELADIDLLELARLQAPLLPLVASAQRLPVHTAVCTAQQMEEIENLKKKHNRYECCIVPFFLNFLRRSMMMFRSIMATSPASRPAECQNCAQYEERGGREGEEIIAGGVIGERTLSRFICLCWVSCR